MPVRQTQELGPAWGEIARLFRQLSIASLAIILIGLIVAWTGYLNRVRWTWFVMFIVVWGWAFPLMILPLFRTLSVPMPELLSHALKQSGIAREAVEAVLIFLLMLIALFLPIRSFAFLNRKPDTTK
jgi:hypothetical protein